MQFGQFLADPSNGRHCRIDGCLPSDHLPNKYKLQQDFSSHMCCSAPHLPPKVDLRSAMTPIEDQATVGSCVGCALAGAYEYLLKKATGRHIDVSRLFVYYNARAKKYGSGQMGDTGCTIPDAIEALDEFGICVESVWPYDTSAVNERPSDEAYDAAEINKLADALRIDQDLDSMKICLAQGYPFIFATKLPESFNEAAKRGVVPKPGATDKVRTTHGRHAMLVVGYSDKKRAFIVRNSWGQQWGYAGYCYMSYDYLTDPKYCYDMWAIRKIEVDDIGHEHWDNNDDDDDHDDFNMYRNRQGYNSPSYQNRYVNNFAPEPYGYVDDSQFDPFGNGNHFGFNPFGNDNNFASNPYGYDPDLNFNQFGNVDNFASNPYGYVPDSGYNQFGFGNNFGFGGGGFY